MVSKVLCRVIGEPRFDYKTSDDYMIRVALIMPKAVDGSDGKVYKLASNSVFYLSPVMKGGKLCMGGPFVGVVNVGRIVPNYSVYGVIGDVELANVKKEDEEKKSSGVSAGALNRNLLVSRSTSSLVSTSTSSSSTSSSVSISSTSSSSTSSVSISSTSHPSSLPRSPPTGDWKESFRQFSEEEMISFLRAAMKEMKCRGDAKSSREKKEKVENGLTIPGAKVIYINDEGKTRYGTVCPSKCRKKVLVKDSLTDEEHKVDIMLLRPWSKG